MCDVPELGPGELLSSFIPRSVEKATRNDPPLVRSVKRVIAFDEIYRGFETSSQNELDRPYVACASTTGDVGPPRIVLNVLSEDQMEDFVRLRMSETDMKLV